MSKIIFLEMTDIDTWDRAITKFRVVLEEVQTKLAGSLAFIHSPDKNKSGVKTKAKGVLSYHCIIFACHTPIYLGASHRIK